MKLSNQLVSLPQLSGTMRAMSEEMMKVRPSSRSRLLGRRAHPFARSQAGIMSEMLDETMDGLDEDEVELEEEAQEEVDKVLWQITDGKLGQSAGKVGALPVSGNVPSQLLHPLTFSCPAKDWPNTGGVAEGRGDGAGNRQAARLRRGSRIPTLVSSLSRIRCTSRRCMILYSTRDRSNVSARVSTCSSSSSSLLSSS